MYPDLYYMFKDWFNVDWTWLHHIHTAGFFMALGIIIPGMGWKMEYRRRERIGNLTYIINRGEQEWPHDWIFMSLILAAIGGIIGAKLFAVLEYWQSFLQSPLSLIFSSYGWTFYGSLILCTIILWTYHYKFRIQRMRMTDALVPFLTVGYAFGRLGCQISGDGDWGIINSYEKPFTWLPDWLWAYDYPHNVLRQGTYMSSCEWNDYCTYLTDKVYPTPVYEIIAMLPIFWILMWLRKRIHIAGRLTAMYLVLIGIERLLIEQIRVNVKYSVAGFHFTQAEAISVFAIIGGIVLYLLSPKMYINRINNLQLEPGKLQPTDYSELQKATIS